MSDQDKHNIPTIPEASHEGGVLVKTPYTIEISIKVSDGSAAVTHNRPIIELVRSALVGIGRVDLHSISVSYIFTAEDLSIQAAITDENNASALEDLMGFDGNFMSFSNAFNKGVRHEIDLKVPGMYSKQLQPTSSQLPRCKLQLAVTQGTRAWLNIKLVHYGLIRRVLAFA
jgi:hypothetical protein